MTPPVALTIAGVDPAGGAGIAADLRTFAALGVHGALAVTTLTVQDTVSVRRAVASDPALVAEQIDVVLADLDVAAAKTGFLGSVAVAEVVADRASGWGALVVDPVLVAHDGRPILDAADTYRRRLLPRATVATPNHREAALLAGIEVTTVADMVAAAHRILELGPTVVVVTGGAIGTADAVDVAVDATEVRELRSARVPTRNTHGSGCTFAAATAALLARGEDPWAAVTGAKAFVSRAVAAGAAWRLGAGRGPLDQLAGVARPPLRRDAPPSS